MKSNRVKFTILILCLVLNLASCGRQDVNIEIGTNTWIGYEPLYVVKEKHYKNDFKYHLTRFNNATEVLQSLKQGRLDIAGLTLDEAIIALSRGIDLQFLSIMDISDGADQLLVKPSTQNLMGLKGQRIAVESTAVGALLLNSVLLHSGLTKEDVVLINATVDQHEQLFQENRIDAAITFPPFSDRLLKAKMVKLFDSSMMSKAKIIDVLVVRRVSYKKFKPQIDEFVSQLPDAISLIERHDKETIKLVGTNLGLPEEEWEDMNKGILFGNHRINSKYLDKYKLEADMLILNDIMLEQGLLTRSVKHLINSSLFIKP
jgi:NitT/TauT family transport system substrate-binding protein